MPDQETSSSPELNEAQAAAVRFGSGALRIMAGAGAGKTFTLTHSIVALIERRLATPSQILAMTFTTKAAEELRGRINTEVMKLVDSGETVDVDTYHAFGGRIVAEQGYRRDLPPEPRVLTPAESWIMLWRALDRIEFRSIELGNLRGGGWLPSPLKAMLDLGSRLADERRTLNDLDALIERAMDPELAIEDDYLRALAVYEDEKRMRGAIDYGDQIAIACDLLDIPAVRDVYAGRYRYVVVDEFQDTNYAQSIMVHSLATAIGGNVRVVGDPNQAIYSFRGAAPDNLERFATTEFPAATTIPLSLNYRSTSSILDLANAIWAEEPGEFRGNLKAGKPNVGSRPKVVQCAAFEDEVAYITGEIERLVVAGQRYKEIAVLVRKNRIKSEVWRGLRAWGIPAEAIGGSSLYETPEVRLLISALRVIGGRNDDPAFAHLLLADRWGIDERALHALAIDRKTDESLFAAARRMTDRPEDEAFLSLQDCLREVDRLVTRSYRVSLPRLVDELIAVVGGSYDAVQEANVRRFREVARAFAESHVGDKPNLSELISYLDLLLDAGPDEEAASEIDLDETDTVKIMTAHAAKGLEWPVVFVAGVNANDFAFKQQKTGRKRDALPPELARSTDGRPVRSEFPDGPAGRQAFVTAIDVWRKTEDDLEERRVFYVAVTRAREHLYLTWSETVPWRTSKGKVYATLAPITHLCDHVLAPPAPPKPDARTVEPFARQTIPQLTPLLAAAGTDPGSTRDVIAQLDRGWQSAGGDPGVPERAMAQFVSEKAIVGEQVAALRAMEARTAESDGVSLGARGPISYSQLETFRACPHRYYLRHVVGVPGLPQTWAASYGSAFHEAIALEAKLRQDGQPVSIEDLRNWVHADLARSSGAVVGDGGSAAGVDPIAAYVASVDHQAEPLLIEESFTLRLDNVVINGVIDRLHRLPNGETEVVDYKTDRRLRAAEEVKNGLQLPIYLLACREIFADVCEPPLRAAMFFVRHGQRIEVEYTETELEAARARIVAEGSRLAVIDPNQHSASAETCGPCEFRLTCRHAHPGARVDSSAAD